MTKPATKKRVRSYGAKHMRTEVPYRVFDPLKDRVEELELSVTQLQRQMARLLLLVGR